MVRRRKTRKGITGIEAAIVMIAFVVVAAALAFVVLNMGMFTTQRAREVINKGLGEASSALEVDGSVTGITDSSGSGVELVSIPIKLAPGRESVDLAQGRTTISVITDKLAYEDWHQGVDPTQVTDKTNLTKIYEDLNNNNLTGAFVLILNEKTDDTVLEFGEKALVVIKLPSNSLLGPYETIRVEIRPPEGAPLTVERSMPAILPANQAISLG